MAAAVLLLLTSLGIRTTSAAVPVVLDYACNAAKFDADDKRGACVNPLLIDLLGDQNAMYTYNYYDTYDGCDYGRSVIYGYLYSEPDSGVCIGKAMDALLNRQYCGGRMGGQASGEGCFMRFEVYDFADEVL
ncbi:unnamed protein product [Linum trigynum]|uniref:Gnk2-homologous domain-containing protein n=1 Tax=Linum trigynum TaxID=586398 RepID=A0AAV2EYZ3_9ROSI